jgi:nitrite reductase/ring-hydroxylating ferredoxin subunit/DMSO/TMAO reductase YedYZ heme-binding membrane subunit
MSHLYKAVGWNRQKRIYDGLLWLGLLAYLLTFGVIGRVSNPNITAETLIIRALGTAALLLLHLILSIGPLSRIDRRFLPLLYNRRHMGVSLFLLAAGHGLFSLVQFHALGTLNPLLSLLSGNGSYDSPTGFPFQALGMAALILFFLLAATSHDFWLANLGPATWKTLHLAIYPAYGLVVMHVALGALQSERQAILAALMGLGLVWVLGLQVWANWREGSAEAALASRARKAVGKPGESDRAAAAPAAQPKEGPTWIELCESDTIAEGRARIFRLGDAQVAVFRHADKFSAISNVCAHQGGPLGEGRIIDGCVTCPWHGYQYLPESGQSPPPFEEKIPTYRLALQGKKLLIDARALPPGTWVEPARWAYLEGADPGGADREGADREGAEKTIARSAPREPGVQE